MEPLFGWFEVGYYWLNPWANASNPMPHSHFSFYHSLQESESRTPKLGQKSVPIYILTFFRLEHRIVQVCITYSKILLKEGHISLIFTNANG